MSLLGNIGNKVQKFICKNFHNHHCGHHTKNCFKRIKNCGRHARCVRRGHCHSPHHHGRCGAKNHLCNRFGGGHGPFGCIPGHGHHHHGGHHHMGGCFGPHGSMGGLGFGGGFGSNFGFPGMMPPFGGMGMYG